MKKKKKKGMTDDESKVVAVALHCYRQMVQRFGSEANAIIMTKRNGKGSVAEGLEKVVSKHGVQVQ